MTGGRGLAMTWAGPGHDGGSGQGHDGGRESGLGSAAYVRKDADGRPAPSMTAGESPKVYAAAGNGSPIRCLRSSSRYGPPRAASTLGGPSSTMRP